MVLRQVARVLRPGGIFVHVGVHPCFCGGFGAAHRPLPELRHAFLDAGWHDAAVGAWQPTASWVRVAGDGRRYFATTIQEL